MDVERVNFSNLIDIDELKYLFSDLSDITGFTVSLVDVVTNELLLQVGWRDICTKFHRAHPESEALCEKSNKKLTAGLKRADEIRIDYCDNGLIHACIPIIIQGDHLANLFTGQMLFSPPDLERFKSQAHKFGYDEQRYLKSLNRVPVVSEERASSFLRYLAKKITSIAQKNLDLMNSNAESMRHKDLLLHIAKLAPVGIGVTHNLTIQWGNRAMSQITGYSDNELTELKVKTLYPSSEDFMLAEEDLNVQFKKRGRAIQEARWKKKDGSLIDVYVRAAFLNNDISSGKIVFIVLDITKQVKNKKALKRSEERLSLTLDATNLGLWDSNISTGETFYNDRYFTMLGYQTDEFPHTFETWKKLLHPDDLEKSLRKIEATLSGDNPENIMEFRMLTATGDYRWILGHGKIIEYSHDGIPLRVIGIHQDITQQKLIEEELQNKGQKYQELFNNIKCGVTIYTAIEDGSCFVIEERNAGAEKITGVTNGESLGKRVSELFPGLEALGVLDVYRRVYKTGIPESIPLVRYQDEILDLWVEIYIFKILSGQIVAIYNDFTEQKKAEDKEKSRAEQLEQIINLAPDAFLLGDNEGTVIAVNQQATVLSGYSHDELLGQKLSFLFAKSDLEKTPLNFALLKSGGVLMRERKLLQKNGTTISIEMHSKMMPDGTYQSFVRDITARKHAENSLLNSQRDLKKKRSQLEETNTALKILIKQSEQEKMEVEENVAANVLSLVEPHLNKLKMSELNKSQANHIQIIESTLHNLVSPFVRTSVAMSLKLSPAEIRVSNLIKQGKTSKQIAELLGLSAQTIDKHRSHIRKKIGVTNKDVSLRELLTSRF